MRRYDGWRRWLLLAGVLGLLCAAPTPGDIGGCQPARELDGPAFFQAKRAIDCEHCEECDIDSKACRRACDAESANERELPRRCAPLTHDGAVCLRALMNASCNDYRAFMSDSSPELPTECNFCPSDSPGRER